MKLIASATVVVWQKHTCDLSKYWVTLGIRRTGPLSADVIPKALQYSRQARDCHLVRGSTGTSFAWIVDDTTTMQKIGMLSVGIVSLLSLSRTMTWA